MWLEVGTSNNDPTVVVQYFVDCIIEVGGTARIVLQIVVQKTAMLLEFNVSLEAIQMTPLQQRSVSCIAVLYRIKG